MTKKSKPHAQHRCGPLLQTVWHGPSMCWSQLSATQKWPTQSRCRLKSRLAWAKEPCNLIKLRPGCPNRKKHFRGGHVPNTPWMMDTVFATAGHQSINQSCIFRVVQVIKLLQDPLKVGNNLPGISDNVRERGLERKCF